jgi:hypothetical protein
MAKKVKKTKKTVKKQRGGLPQGGTSGDLGTFTQDIVGVIEATFDTIKYSTESIIGIIEIPSDMGRAWSDPGAPKPSDIHL